MNLKLERARAMTRREFFLRSQLGLGSVALAALMQGGNPAFGKAAALQKTINPLAPKLPPLPAKAKSIIYLHMSGAPPQLDLFDYKPKLTELNMQPCPDELLKGQRFAFIKGHPK